MMGMIMDLIRNKAPFAVMSMGCSTYYAVAVKGSIPPDKRWRRASGYDDVIETRLTDTEAQEFLNKLHHFEEACDNIFGKVYELRANPMRKAHRRAMRAMPEDEIEINDIMRLLL